jgi:hypothetical protein
VRPAFRALEIMPLFVKESVGSVKRFLKSQKSFDAITKASLL